MKTKWTRSTPPRIHEIARLTGWSSKITRDVVDAIGHQYGYASKSLSSPVPLSIAIDATHYLSRVRHGDYPTLEA